MSGYLDALKATVTILFYHKTAAICERSDLTLVPAVSRHILFERMPLLLCYRQTMTTCHWPMFCSTVVHPVWLCGRHSTVKGYARDAAWA